MWRICSSAAPLDDSARSPCAPRWDRRAGAGLLMRSFLRLTNVDPGFRPESVLTVSVTLPQGSYPTSAEMRRFAREALARIHVVPGVVRAGAVNWLPLGGQLLSGDFIV